MRPLVPGWSAEDTAGDVGRMASAQHGCHLPGAAPGIGDRRAIGPQAPAPGEAAGERLRLLVVRWQRASISIRGKRAIRAQPLADASGAEAPGLHAPGACVGERRFVDVAQGGKPVGQGPGIRLGCTVPAALAELGGKVSHQAGARGLETLDIAERRRLEARLVQGWPGPPGAQGSPRLCHRHLAATVVTRFER